MPTLNLLRLDEVDLISLVDRPDNPLAKVTLAKREGYEEPEDDGDAIDAEVKNARAWLLRKLAKLFGDGDAITFEEAGVERRINDDIWNLTYRLEESLRSIMGDEEVEDKAEMVAESLEQFKEAVNAAVPVWSAGGSVTDKTEKKETEMSEKSTETGAEAIAFEDLDLSALDEESQKALETLAERAGEADALAEKNEALATKVDELEPEIETLSEKVEGLEKALADDEGEEEPEGPEIPEAVQKQIDEEREKREDAEKRLAKIEDERENARYVSKSAALDGLPGITPDDFGPKLRKVAKAFEDDEDAFEDLFETLKGAAEAIKEGALFEEAGADGDGSANTARAELKTRAKARKESKPDLSMAQAEDAVLEEDPDLRQRVLDEEQAAAE